MMNWTLYTDESGGFDGRDRSVFVGVLWPSNHEMSPARVKQELLHAVPGVVWNRWHRGELSVMARQRASREALRDTTRAIQQQFTRLGHVYVIASSHQSPRDKVPSARDARLRLLRVLMERVHDFLCVAFPDDAHEVVPRISAWGGSKVDCARRLVQTIIHDGRGRTKVQFMDAEIVPWGNDVECGFVLADYCANLVRASIDSESVTLDVIERRAFRLIGIPLRGGARPLLAASGSWWTNWRWVRLGDDTRRNDADCSGSWCAQQAREWKGALRDESTPHASSVRT